MRPITQEMVRQYRLKQLGYDFMGYTFTNPNQLSFHHLIVPRRDCEAAGLGDGYLFWNGAILKQNTSHDYLHLIEKIDRQKFLAITDLMVKENKLGELSLSELRAIHIILQSFEQEHQNDKNKHGEKILKRRYITERINLL